MTRKRSIILLLALAIICLNAAHTTAADMPEEKESTNSIGMRLIRIEPGSFMMGQLKTLDPEVLPVIDKGGRGGRFDLMAEGNYDERPVHRVRITKPFAMSSFEVTNKQYELFDPDHRNLRGKHGLSNDDDEAVIYVNWYDAQAFCQWLSDKEGLPYRLPTEAEWEYACRAGTATNYYMGDLPGEEFVKQPGRIALPRPTPLKVGKTTPNPWGLYDMHGNVEEWCYDWYGPYIEGPQIDPVGYAKGNFRVSRGGSYATFGFFLRSANRAAMLPADRNWMIGFRVAIGELPDTKGLPEPEPQPHQQNVIDRDSSILTRGPDCSAPYFDGPRKFLNIPRESIGPVFAGHNHNPAIAECPNGDLLAITYTCVSEKDRELAVAGTRLRYGSEQWEQPALFWDLPDRNDHAPVLWYDDKTKKIFHFQPYSVGATYHTTLAIAMRTSSDSGATWTRPRIILPKHIAHETIRSGHQLSEPVFRMNDGGIAIVTDGMPTLWTSHDEGLTWKSCGGTLSGIHPGVVQLRDGRLLGLIRNNEFWTEDEVITEYEDFAKEAKNISSDRGKTWDRFVSPFPYIDGGQRLVLMRLREGPLLLASFANYGMIITDAAGKKREVRGLYVALSEDEGETWPYVKLVRQPTAGTL
ncbi:MAG: SUMF1/EgtB/PvdO family nonheme iron enzyme [Planctomycetota bacterium]